MAASTEKPQRRMLRIGDGWFPNATSTEAFTQGWQQIEALAKETGADASRLHRALYTTLNINEDQAQAEREMPGVHRGLLQHALRDHRPYPERFHRQRPRGQRLAERFCRRRSPDHRHPLRRSRPIRPVRTLREGGVAPGAGLLTYLNFPSDEWLTVAAAGGEPRPSYFLSLMLQNAPVVEAKSGPRWLCSASWAIPVPATG